MTYKSKGRAEAGDKDKQEFKTTRFEFQKYLSGLSIEDKLDKDKDETRSKESIHIEKMRT